MLHSSATEYAIRALTHLAERPEGELTLLEEISGSEELPRAFLGKILKELVRAGLLRSSRGPGGGYALARPAGQITLLEIRRELEGVSDLERCAVGLEPCSDETPCPLHEIFKPLREAIRDYLEETTVEDLVNGLREKRARLAARERSGGPASGS
jgi:Rrf2 family protein